MAAYTFLNAPVYQHTGIILCAGRLFTYKISNYVFINTMKTIDLSLLYG